MSQVKGKDTSIERLVRSELHRRGYRFRKHVQEIRGKPDIVFSRRKLAVFLDGDFWHGCEFPEWKGQLSDFWKRKIGKNIERDNRNVVALEEMGWHVIRIWEHELKEDFEGAVSRIVADLDKSLVASV